QGLARGIGLRIPVQREQAALATQPRQDRAAVAAAAEGAVHVDTVGPHREPFHRLLQQHRAVEFRGAQSTSLASSSGNPPAEPSSPFRLASRRASQLACCQSSNLRPSPNSTTSRSRPAKLRSSGGSSRRLWLSISTSVAWPSNRRCSSRACLLRLGRRTRRSS